MLYLKITIRFIILKRHVKKKKKKKKKENIVDERIATSTSISLTCNTQNYYFKTHVYIYFALQRINNVLETFFS